MTTTHEHTTAYWQMACAATARHAAALLRLAGRRVTGREVLAVIASAPRSFTDVDDPEHQRTSYCRRCLDEVYEVRHGMTEWSEEWATYNEAAAHFTQIMPSLGPTECERIAQSFAGLFLGLRNLDYEVVPDEAWPMYLKSELWRNADAVSVAT